MTSRKSLSTDAIRLIRQFQPALLAYILTLYRNHTDAQDILQETNVVLWQKISLFQEGTSFKAWALRIAYLQTLAHFKRIKRGRWLGFAPEIIEMLAQESGPFLDDFEERHRALRDCIDRLPEEDRKIWEHTTRAVALSRTSASVWAEVSVLSNRFCCVYADP